MSDGLNIRLWPMVMPLRDYLSGLTQSPRQRVLILSVLRKSFSRDDSVRKKKPRDEPGVFFFVNLWLTIRLFSRGEKMGWSGRPGLNRRPSPWQGDVLPLNYCRVSEEDYNTGSWEMTRRLGKELFLPNPLVFFLFLLFCGRSGRWRSRYTRET